MQECVDQVSGSCDSYDLTISIKKTEAVFKDFNVPTESWEQIARNRAKRRGFIRRDDGEYEAGRLSLDYQ